MSLASTFISDLIEVLEAWQKGQRGGGENSKVEGKSWGGGG